MDAVPSVMEGYHVPMYIGYVNGRSSVKVLGAAYDQTTQLIALSVYGPSTAVEALHYDMQNSDKLVTIETEWGFGYSRRMKAGKRHFRIIKAPIPDSTDVHMIMVSDLMSQIDPAHQFTFDWFEDDESFKQRMFHRIRSMVYVSVLPQWTDYLYLQGSLRKFDGSSRMCGRLPNKVRKGEHAETNYWMACGFDIGYIANSREAWEKIISDGLANRAIFLD